MHGKCVSRDVQDKAIKRFQAGSTEIEFPDAPTLAIGYNLYSIVYNCRQHWATLDICSAFIRVGSESRTSYVIFCGSILQSP